MEFIRSLTQLRPRHYQRGGVATIGNFDGVHRGHQTVLQQVLVTARQLQLPSTVIIFEPQPQEFFAPTTVPARLTRLREKILAMQRYAIDQILCLRFNAEFATWSASEFIQRVLVEGIQVQHLVVGDDFRFGQARILPPYNKLVAIMVLPLTVGKRLSSMVSESAVPAFGKPWRKEI